MQALNAELEQGCFFASITCGGGDFETGSEREAVYPWRGGLAGLLKCACAGVDCSRFRAVDVESAEDVVPELLLSEWAAGGDVEIGYRAGKRWALQPVRADLDGGSQLASPPIHAGSVVLVTGGARGITAQIVRELAQRARPKFILLGRSALSEHAEDVATAEIQHPLELRKLLAARARQENGPPSLKAIEAKVRELLAQREIRETIAEIRRAGAKVEYLSCDVCDAVALERVVREMQQKYGRITGIIHGAGIIEDARIAAKTVDSFDRVLATKINPLLNLQCMLDPAQIEFCIIFSSVAGFFGNPGQGDYAAANEILNRMACRMNRSWAGKIVSMNWGPWSGAGMVTPEVAQQFAARCRNGHRGSGS